MYTHYLDDNVIEYNRKLIDIFNKYGFDDISYGNDCCNSVAYNLGEDYYFQVFLPNSKKDDYDNENWNTFSLNLQNNELYIDNLFDLYSFTECIEDVLGFIESNKNIIKG
tara:strand:- start:259 stop:588 length:330 start_codon:yes stop_codon:yes gene_type:complete